MSIGYACQTVGVPNTDQKSCIMKNASDDNLLIIISHNLTCLEKIINFNIENSIMLFRISSDIIPFGSSIAKNLPWWEIFASEIQAIGIKIQSSGMRVSMHPGQYTVLNSPNEDVVDRAIDDLNYHTKVLDSLGVGSEHKIVLHIGGIYNDKIGAINRFIANYHRLNENVIQRLVFENDDKSYNISDVLEIAAILNVPVIFDNLHNKIKPSDLTKSEGYWIDKCSRTWKQKDGNQKMHYSQQNMLKRSGSHSISIWIDEFMELYQSLDNKAIDIMLEVKDKNLSAVKCINCTTHNNSIKALKLEWSKYKYAILERSPINYAEIRKLFSSKDEYTAINFYNLVEEALRSHCTTENSINAALHIWRYLKDTLLEKEKASFLKHLDDYRQGKIPIRTIKNSLYKMAIKSQKSYLINSYYFVF